MVDITANFARHLFFDLTPPKFCPVERRHNRQPGGIWAGSTPAAAFSFPGPQGQGEKENLENNVR
nr:MAG TPA: hypothetical protein [Caudoviricetes sp.]